MSKSGPTDLAAYHAGSPGQKAWITRKSREASQSRQPVQATGEVMPPKDDFTSLSDLTPDPRNARKHGERNIATLEKSLEQFGAARSIVVDEHGRILAGNGVVEAAANVGIERVKTVEADGNEIIAVVRRGLTEAQKLGLAVADNRVAELAEWDTTMLAQIGTEIDLTPFFTEQELGDLLSDTEHLREVEKSLQPKQFVRVLVSVPIDHAAEAKELLDQLATVPEIEIDYSAN
jgi:hypothetical protein